MPSASPRHDPGAEDLRRDLKDAQERLRATGEVLQALGRSGSDLEDVLGTVVRSAQSLCRRDAAQLHLFEGGSYRLAWHSGLSDEFRAFVAEHPRFAADHGCASEISRDALVIGRRLAREGVLGRFALATSSSSVMAPEHGPATPSRSTSARVGRRIRSSPSSS
jgi:hypothetical protein